MEVGLRDVTGSHPQRGRHLRAQHSDIVIVEKVSPAPGEELPEQVPLDGRQRCPVGQDGGDHGHHHDLPRDVQWR